MHHKACNLYYMDAQYTKCGWHHPWNMDATNTLGAYRCCSSHLCQLQRKASETVGKKEKEKTEKHKINEDENIDTGEQTKCTLLLSCYDFTIIKSELRAFASMYATAFGLLYMLFPTIILIFAYPTQISYCDIYVHNSLSVCNNCLFCQYR